MARPFRSLPIPPAGSQSTLDEDGGFSLIELLIGLVMGGVLMAAAASTVVSQIRSGNTMEIAQSLRNDMGRLTSFLESEIGEGDTISYGVAITGAGGCTGVSGNSLFTINVPNLGATGTALPTTPIHYYVSGSGNTALLNRCGPPIKADGSLDLAGTRIDTPVSRNTTLTLTNTTNTEAVNYNLTLRDPNGANPLARSGLSTKTRVTLIN